MPDTARTAPRSSLASAPRKSLSYFITLFCPEYRGLLIMLLALGAAASFLIYSQNELLGMLVKSFSSAPGALGLAGAKGTATGGGHVAPKEFLDLAVLLGMSLPALVLGFLVLARTLYALIAYVKLRTDGRLNIKAKSDLETEILLNLLHKDDQFFSRHSPAETINRLVLDLQRVNQRRSDLVEAWWSGLLLAGNLIFFLSKDWRLALVALAGCAGGVLWTRRVAHRIQALDARFMHQEDQVKSSIEDFLASAFEVQTGNRYNVVRDAFVKTHAERAVTFLEFVRQNSRMSSGYVLTSILTFTTMVLVLLYMRRAGGFNEAVALVPVVVWTLPPLFDNARQLVMIRLKFHIATTSIKRLLEYESTAKAAQVAVELPGRDALLQLRDASFRYHDAAELSQPGIADLTAEFRPGRWTAIVGRSGAGKTTLLKLLLGRLAPQKGSVAYGDQSLSALSPEAVAATFSFLPNPYTLLNTSIQKNVLFALADPLYLAGPEELSDAGLALVEDIGLGQICRLKALDQTLKDAPAAQTLAQNITSLRLLTREKLFSTHKIGVAPFEEGNKGRRHWILERILDGKCDQEPVLSLLLRNDGRLLRRLLGTALQDKLAAIGREVLHEYSRLLAIPDYYDFAQLTPFPVSHGLWRLRVAYAHLAERDALTRKEKAGLLLVALSASAAELPRDGAGMAFFEARCCESYPRETKQLRRILAGMWESFDASRVHPYLTWRENLTFGDMEITSSRSARLADLAILETIASAGFSTEFTRLGLSFPVGRKGVNLTAGQGQLVALCRTVISNSPAMILDEPTAALDPASRSKLASFLTDWKKERIVITVTKDAALAAYADEVLALEGGKLEPAVGIPATQPPSQDRNQQP